MRVLKFVVKTAVVDICKHQVLAVYNVGDELVRYCVIEGII